MQLGPWISVTPRTDAMIKKTLASPWPDRSTSFPSREGKRGGNRFDPPKSGSATDRAEQNVWSNCRPVTASPEHSEGHYVCTAMKCNAISSHPSTGHAVAPCDQPHPAAPTPGARTLARGREAKDLVESPSPARRCGTQRRPRHQKTRLRGPR